ncbi:class I SAM-dependent methyltransferase [Halomicroarcula sp. F13]|uniref:Class I SAM-dependent methyltransferase n=1 Tax=Haloarcula rubra TaxID=2487747 RepID=A0AAW4PQM9_9EURY|nr:class I SAM-dependent methyltransferase [Halomicroarcula rubra]MBX0322514.1 class I SAM-dependent methyltransferase [Halomicroarcula rubra]
MADLPETDAFGAMCRDYHDHGDAFEVVERDDGFVDCPAGPEVYFSPPEEWDGREHTALAWAEGRVLDVGCGPGRHALELQRRGHDVTGIDLSPGAMAVARDRGVADVRECDVADADGLDEQFDTALMLGNNFGLVGSADRAPTVLGALADATTHDATLVASSLDPLDTDDPAHLDYHERNRERGWLPGRLRIRTRYRRYTGVWHDYLHVAPETMRELVADTVWSVAEVEREGALYVARLEKGD